ncbi:uncharacterized protein LOC113294741 [Papaver somniferum]|uniref:uncharacterized protein LOC113294741 n=1 Tax=Papaver somniferum TaxID=3469 RepID=UPI000E70478D|nr:uncharacterized protein LOC113294741 [Papaver somniferum]
MDIEKISPKAKAEKKEELDFWGSQGSRCYKIPIKDLKYFRMTTSTATPTTNETATPTTSTTQQTEVGSSSQAASHTNESETATPTSKGRAEAVEVGDSKKKHGRVRSSVWLEMTRIDDEWAECRYCHNKYKAHNDNNGTSGLRKHLNRCLKNPNRKKEKGQPSLLMPPPKPGQDGKLIAHTYNYDRLRRRLVEWIIKDEIPFRKVEGSGFVALMQEARPRFKVPGRMTIYRDMLKIGYL